MAGREKPSREQMQSVRARYDEVIANIDSALAEWETWKANAS